MLPYLIVFPLAFSNFSDQVDRHSYRVDETGWTRSAIHVANLLAAMDLTPSRWQAEEELAYGSINPQLSKVFIAFPILMGWVPVEEHLPPGRVYYDLTLDLSENRRRGAVIPPEILHPLRRVSVVFGVFFCLVCMGMVHAACGPLTAFLAGLALARNPLIAEVSSSVLTDISYQSFLFAAALCTIWGATTSSRGLGMRRQVWAGALAGVATACKYSAPLFVMPFQAVTLVIARAEGRLSRTRMYATLGLSTAALLGVVYLSNPMLWPDVTKFSREGLSRDLRLLHSGEIVLRPGEPGPPWIRMLGYELEKSARAEEPPKLRLKADSHAALLDHMLNAGLATVEPALPELRPQNIVPTLYAVSRPLLLPVTYLRWAYFKEWVSLAPDWLHRDSGRFVRYLRTRYLVFPWEVTLAAIGCLTLLCAGAQGRSLSTPRRLLLAYALYYVVVLYATRINDLDRYLIGMIALRCMLAAIGAVTLIRVTFMGLRALRNRYRHA